VQDPDDAPVAAPQREEQPARVYHVPQVPVVAVDLSSAGAAADPANEAANSQLDLPSVDSTDPQLNQASLRFSGSLSESLPSSFGSYRLPLSHFPLRSGSDGAAVASAAAAMSVNSATSLVTAGGFSSVLRGGAHLPYFSSAKDVASHLASSAAHAPASVASMQGFEVQHASWQGTAAEPPPEKEEEELTISPLMAGL